MFEKYATEVTKDCTEEDSPEEQQKKMATHNFLKRIRCHIKEAQYLAYQLLHKGFCCVQADLSKKDATLFSKILHLAYEHKVELLDKYESNDINRDLLTGLWKTIAAAN